LARIEGAFFSDAACVVAAGKAAAPMFEAVSEVLRIERAVVATAPRPSTAVSAAGAVDVFEAGHPSPNQASVAAGGRALAIAQHARRSTLLVLLSGGASAMLSAPAEGVTLDDKVETSRALMSAGAAIHELNCVRKHLSRIKGGQLAAAAQRTVTLALSDVHSPIADDPAVIGSGPTVPDRTTFADALDVIRHRRIDARPSVLAHLELGARGGTPETIKTGDPRIAESVYEVIGNRTTAVDGAQRAAQALGYHVIVVEAATTGEAREAGAAFVEQATERARGARLPVCVIGSGETTVTVLGSGSGGRNQEFALGAAPLLVHDSMRGQPPSLAVVLGSAGTDGIDGPTDAAGAIADVTTLDRAARLGLDPRSALETNDAYPFFRALGDLIVWGPTGTNVGDLHVLLMG
jgi:glycerate 2-kinase